MSIVQSRFWNRYDADASDDLYDDEVPTQRRGEVSDALPSPPIAANEAFVRVRAGSSRWSNDRFVGKFLALMLAGVTDELVAEVLAVGPQLSELRPGDRVVVPATVPRSRVANLSNDGHRVLRIPSADRVLMKVPDELRGAPDDQILFLYRRRLEWLE